MCHLSSPFVSNFFKHFIFPNYLLLANKNWGICVYNRLCLISVKSSNSHEKKFTEVSHVLLRETSAWAADVTPSFRCWCWHHLQGEAVTFLSQGGAPLGYTGPCSSHSSPVISTSIGALFLQSLLWWCSPEDGSSSFLPHPFSRSLQSHSQGDMFVPLWAPQCSIFFSGLWHRVAVLEGGFLGGN